MVQCRCEIFKSLAFCPYLLPLSYDCSYCYWREQNKPAGGSGENSAQQSPVLLAVVNEADVIVDWIVVQSIIRVALANIWTSKDQ